MRLLDLVEEHDAVRMRAHGVDQQASLLEADVSRGRADQARHRVFFHVLAHVVADELVAQVDGELARELGLADAGRSGEEEAAGGMIRHPEPGPGPLDGGHDRRNRFDLSEDDAL